MMPMTTLLQVEGKPEVAVERAGGVGTPARGGALLGALLRVPDLATPEDREQLAGITSLAALLQELSTAASAAADNGVVPSAQPPPRLPVPDFLRPLLPAQASGLTESNMLCLFSLAPCIAPCMHVSIPVRAPNAAFPC